MYQYINVHMYVSEVKMNNHTNVQPIEISQEIRHELEQTEPRFNLQ